MLCSGGIIHRFHRQEGLGGADRKAGRSRDNDEAVQQLRDVRRDGNRQDQRAQERGVVASHLQVHTTSTTIFDLGQQLFQNFF